MVLSCLIMVGAAISGTDLGAMARVLRIAGGPTSPHSFRNHLQVDNVSINLASFDISSITFKIYLYRSQSFKF